MNSRICFIVLMMLTLYHSAKAATEPRIYLSSTVYKSVNNFDPFFLTAGVENFPDVTSVMFYQNGEFLGSDTVAPYTWVATALEEGIYRQTYTAIATNTSGQTLSSSPYVVIININPGDSDILVISAENSAVMVSGGPPVLFEAIYQEAFDGEGFSPITWTLEGLGSLSTTEGDSTLYTPPATLVEEALGGFAMLTATLPNGYSARHAITFRRARNSTIYSVFARIDQYTWSTDVSVTIFESNSSTVFSEVTVKVNGAIIPFQYGQFKSSITPLADGESVNLEIEVPEGIIRAATTMPATPVLTEPTNGSSVLYYLPLDVAWTTSEQPTNFEVSYIENNWLKLSDFAVEPGDSTSYSFTGVPADLTLNVGVTAQNKTTELTGPIWTDSELNVYNHTSQKVSITTTPFMRNHE